MATPTLTKTETKTEEPQQELTGLRAQIALMNNPGMYAGAGLGIASGYLTGDPLLLTTIGATSAAAGWAALGMNPGPWRWLPGQGEPWEWMCRRSGRGYRRKVRRMRIRLDSDALAIAVGPGKTKPIVIGVTDGWRTRA